MIRISASIAGILGVGLVIAIAHAQDAGIQEPRLLDPYRLVSDANEPTPAIPPRGGAFVPRNADEPSSLQPSAFETTERQAAETRTEAATTKRPSAADRL